MVSILAIYDFNKHNRYKGVARKAKETPVGAKVLDAGREHDCIGTFSHIAIINVRISVRSQITATTRCIISLRSRIGEVYDLLDKCSQDRRFIVGYFVEAIKK